MMCLPKYDLWKLDNGPYEKPYEQHYDYEPDGEEPFDPEVWPLPDDDGEPEPEEEEDDGES